jgi:hypothetical protein
MRLVGRNGATSKFYGSWPGSFVVLWMIDP